MSFASALSVAIVFVSLVLFKRLGLANDTITALASLELCPWLLRPLIARALPATLSSRLWIVTAEVVSAIFIVIIALMLRTGTYVAETTCLLLLTTLNVVIINVVGFKRYHVPFTSFIAGFMLAMVLCQGLLTAFAGSMEVLTRTVRYSWSVAFYALGGLFLLLALIHIYIIGVGDGRVCDVEEHGCKSSSWMPVLLSLLSLVPEGLLAETSQLFLVDARHNGGLGLAPVEYGLIQGTVAMMGMCVGVWLGSLLRRPSAWSWPMAFALSLPSATMVYLAYTMAIDITTIGVCVLLRLTLFGFGAAVCFRNVIGYRGNANNSVAVLTLPLVVGGLFSGMLQEAMGYRMYFILTAIISVLPLVAVFILKRTRNG